jgi:hypothetical protein
MTSPFTTTSSHLYEQDYQQWLEQTINQLQHRAFSQIDLDNLIEELKDMGKAQKNALASNTTILLMHLLKYIYQPQKRTASWRRTIVEHRRRILRTFKNSPSLKPYFEHIFTECYAETRVDAATETQLPIETFPEECPLAIAEILNPEFLPE